MAEKKQLFQISKKLTESEKPVEKKKPVKKKVVKKAQPPLKEGEFRISSRLFQSDDEEEYEEEVEEQESSEQEEVEESRFKKSEDDQVYLEVQLLSKSYGLLCKMCRFPSLSKAIDAAKSPGSDQTHVVKILPGQAGEMRQSLKAALDYVDAQIKRSGSAGSWALTRRNLNYATKHV